MSTATGSCGTMKGPASALATITSMRAAATRPHLSRQSRRSDLDAFVEPPAGSSTSSSAFAALTRPSPRSRADPDPWVDEAHDHVHDEIDGHDDQGEQDDRALDHGE